MKLIIYDAGQIVSVENVAGVMAYSAEEITVVKTDTYLKTETRLDNRGYLIAKDSEAPLALEAVGVDCELLHNIILEEYL